MQNWKNKNENASGELKGKTETESSRKWKKENNFNEGERRGRQKWVFIIISSFFFAFSLGPFSTNKSARMVSFATRIHENVDEGRNTFFHLFVLALMTRECIISGKKSWKMAEPRLPKKTRQRRWWRQSVLISSKKKIFKTFLCLRFETWNARSSRRGEWKKCNLNWVSYSFWTKFSQSRIERKKV